MDFKDLKYFLVLAGRRSQHHKSVFNVFIITFSKAVSRPSFNIFTLLWWRKQRVLTGKGSQNVHPIAECTQEAIKIKWEEPKEAVAVIESKAAEPRLRP